MQQSILRRLILSYLGFGLVVAAIFPFYANIFVIWKPGMLVWFVFGCLVAGLLMGAVNYLLLNAILLKKLRRISTVANAISNKDLTHQCKIQSADTIGEIIGSFNRMTANLRQLLGQSATLSGEVCQASQGIHDLMGGIASTLNEQTQRAAEITQIIDNLSATSERITVESAEATEQAAQAATLAHQGGDIVQQTLQGMDTLHQAVTQAASAVGNLGQDSDRIGAIIGVIEEIAAQTNLLALNAAIEAARAGEQGRGFSVVADEVRILAEKTATATAEIGGMIQSVQQRTGDAVNAMESGAREVIAGLENARSAGESLQQIVASAEQMTTMVQDIATATRKQGADVASVRRHTGDIGALIGDTLRNTREGADQAARLDELAGSLDNTVTAFKLA